MRERKSSERTKRIANNLNLVTARAVARLSVLSELCVPLVKKGGQFVAMKGAAGPEELVDAKSALNILGVELVEQFDFELPEEDSERTIYVFDKVKTTPKKYPRKPGTPNKSPL